MNEIQLSNDLKRIELEINHHKNIAGQSIWEIGRRLNHVKENDLAHGEFMNWVNSIGMEYKEAQRFMKVANELPEWTTLSNLGSRTLYLIATLPEEERTKEHVTEKGETKKPDEMTVRELQELKKQLKAKDEEIETKVSQIHKLQKQILSTPAQEIRTVEKEVVPADYENIKSDNQQLTEALKEAREREKRAIEAENKAREHYNQLLASRAETEENSQKYKQLSEAIHNAQNELTGKQKLISNYQNLSQLLRTSNEFLSKASAIVYQDLSEVVSQDGLAKRELTFLIERTERFLSDLRKQINNNNIIEGEIINE